MFLKLSGWAVDSKSIYSGFDSCRERKKEML